MFKRPHAAASEPPAAERQASVSALPTKAESGIALSPSGRASAVVAEMSCRVYTALSMSGRPAKAVLADQRAAAMALRTYGLTPLDPAKEEGVKETDGILSAKEEELRRHWLRDKKMIRRAHVVLDLTGPSKSEGVAHELGFARYHLWKPIVRVWPGLGPSIARLEGDAIVENVTEAAALIKTRWGTPLKRLWWRTKLYARCRVRALISEIKEVYNAVH